MAEHLGLSERSADERYQWFAEYQKQMQRATLAERNLAEALQEIDRLNELLEANCSDAEADLRNYIRKLKQGG